VSGIAGILHLDGSPADPALLREMTDALAHRGPDGAGYWTDGVVALGHRLFVTTTEAQRERQPHHDAAACLCLTFDGRLDNREELAAAIRGRGIALREDTDAELVLRAYEAWGEDSPRRLLGDFAYALWDGRERRLFCARDYMGLRPFHFVRAGSHFLFASELHALFRDRRVGAAPNEGMIAEYLAWSITSQRETLFREVNRLPMAHCMSIDANGRSRTWRYWEPDYGRRSGCATDAEFADAFLDVLRASIRARLRSAGSVGSELSGGLDSSTVSVLAGEIAARESGSTIPWRTYSLAFPGLPCDETGWIRDTTALAGFDGHVVGNAGLPPEYFATIVGKYGEFPGYPNNDPLLLGITGASRRDGGRVILTGQGGNEWLEGSLAYLADLVKARQWRCAWRVASGEAAASGCSPVRLLYRHAARPLLRRAIPALAVQPPMLPWLDAGLVARTGLLERIALDTQAPPRASFMQKEMHEIAFSGYQAHAFEAIDRVTSALGVEYRHPFLDRRLVEFCYGLPGEQRLRDGKPKTVLRNAMAGRLPGSVLGRVEQADYMGLFVDALEAVTAASPIGGWDAGARGWVDARQLELDYNSSITAYREGGVAKSGGRVFWGAWMAHGMSIWARKWA
jgi:asparagine synthase (glutamine-hydrolysing)